GGAEIDLVVLKNGRFEVLPPIQKPRLPMLELALERLVRREIDVVGDFLVVVDHRFAPGCAVTRSRSCAAFVLPSNRVTEQPRNPFLNPFPGELRFRSAAEEFQRALLADGVGADEDPVLPRRE